MTEPALDTRIFNEIADLMGDAIGSFIETYLDNSPKLLAGISKAIPEGDLDAVIHNAHQLKGGSGSMGAMQIFRLAKQLEEEAREGTEDNLAGLFGELEVAYVELEKALKAHL